MAGRGRPRPHTPGPRARPAARRAWLPSGTSSPGFERGRAGSATPVVESRPLSPPRGAHREPPAPRPRPPALARLTRGACRGPLRSRLSLRPRCAPAAGAPECPRRGGVPGPRPSPPRPPDLRGAPARKMAAAAPAPRGAFRPPPAPPRAPAARAPRVGPPSAPRPPRRLLRREDLPSSPPVPLPLKKNFAEFGSSPDCTWEA